MKTVYSYHDPQPEEHTYEKMWAYGNHYHVDIESKPWHLSYDSKVGYILMQVSHNWTWDQNFVMGNLNYIGVLKKILVVDYVGLPMVLFTCSLIPTNTWGNATIHQDEHGFWVVNLAHWLPPMAKPYVFPTSLIQVRAWVTPYVLIMNKYMTYDIIRLLGMGKN